MLGPGAHGLKRGHDFRRSFVDGGEPSPLLEVLHHHEQPLLPVAPEGAWIAASRILRLLVGDRIGN